MTSITSSPLHIQAWTQSVPALPGWFGELTLIIHHMQRQGVLAAIEKQVHFARRRFGRYELIDFVAVLFGYAINGEPTLEAFYKPCLRASIWLLTSVCKMWVKVRAQSQGLSRSLFYNRSSSKACWPDARRNGEGAGAITTQT